MTKVMLATLIREPFDSPEWIFETKWDGYRALARKAKTVKMLTRNGKSLNARFPTIVKALESLRSSCVLDGEIVILDKQGRSHFQLLQNYQKSQTGTPYYYIFDLLAYNGKSLTHLPLITRKRMLKELLRSSRSRTLRFSNHIASKGKALFRKAKAQKWEGIIAKKADSSYQFRHSTDWLKIKTKMRQEVVIGGFTEPRGSRKKLGALLIGVYKGNKLHYIGRVGGGFNQASLIDIHKKLQKLARASSPFIDSPRLGSSVTWVQPRLVCEVSFAEWTQGGKLRQPIFEGLRIDKSPKEVVREHA